MRSALDDDNTTAVRVPIGSLRPGDSPRLAGVNAEHVLALAEQDGALPPIIVHRASMRVVDGTHRLAAAKLRGDATVAVRFFDGADEEVFLLAVRENIAHGLPLTLADRRAAAARVLANRPQWSDRAVAAAVGLSPRTVATLRPVPGDGHGAVVSRIGRDGRARPANTGEVRRLVGRYLAEHPESSLLDVARSTGASLRTVRDVRHRMVAGQQPGVAAAGPIGRPGGTPIRRSTPIASGDVLRALRTDPSLRYTESGRTLIRILTMQAAWADDSKRLPEVLPAHCLHTLTDLARSYAVTWQEFAESLETRERGLQALPSAESA